MSVFKALADAFSFKTDPQGLDVANSMGSVSWSRMGIQKVMAALKVSQWGPKSWSRSRLSMRAPGPEPK